MIFGIQCNVVFIVTGLRAGRSGFRIPTGKEILFPERPHGLWVPPSLLFHGDMGSFRD